MRWLSLESAVERILQIYSASKSYFLSEHKSEARFRRLKELYKDPMFEIYLLFYQAVLPVFTMFNRFLQCEAPQIYPLHRQMQLLLSKLLTKFIKPLFMQKYRESDVPYADTRNHVEDSRLYIRLVTSSQIQKRLNGGALLREM